MSLTTLRALLRSVDDHAGKLCLAGAKLSVLVLLVVGSVDVVAQLLGKPLAFKLELSEVFFAVSIFLVLPFIQSQRRHIVVDIFSSRFSPAVTRLVTVMSDLIAIVLFTLISYAIWLLALKSVVIGELAAGYVRFPVYPFKILTAIGTSLTVLIILIQLTRSALPGEDK